MKSHAFYVFKILLNHLGTALGGIILLIALWPLMRVINKRKKIKRKQMLFQRNGGILLHHELSTSGFSVKKMKLFNSEEELFNNILL